MSLPSSMADFVPCDRLLQKAYSTYYTFLYHITSLLLCPLLLVSPASLIVRELSKGLSLQLISFCVGNTLKVDNFASQKDSQN